MAGLPPMLMLYESVSEQETENRRINKQTEGGRGQKHIRRDWEDTKAMDTADVQSYHVLEETVWDIVDRCRHTGGVLQRIHKYYAQYSHIIFLIASKVHFCNTTEIQQ